ncbi:hypothetical protein HSX37_16935|uniref:Uncharacterized protein n=1 Tax=Dendrosporobacter quercicolus TaxID=146817 RepID=A0A1G9KK95_9FIRM|nr:hypothetical protein [Dendrosporobacter quercicolus]NSL49714.1 hypothetical protein [Dendrosporobacter quercicolus DSM 1736]SDL50036.1 hypothetical protein SAMN04488502_10161 [Dendrosporobacter quercicolus]
MEREYFRLIQSKTASNPIVIQAIDREHYPYKMNQSAFAALEDLIVAYYQPDMGLEICDILQSPCFMIANRFRDLFALLEPELRFKGIQLYPLDFDAAAGLKSPAPLYWIPDIEPTWCLHPAARIYDTGIIEELVVKENAVRHKHILKVAGLVEEIWLVSLTAAECILRRRPLAAGLERVKVRE